MKKGQFLIIALQSDGSVCEDVATTGPYSTEKAALAALRKKSKEDIKESDNGLNDPEFEEKKERVSMECAPVAGYQRAWEISNYQ